MSFGGLLRNSPLSRKGDCLMIHQIRTTEKEVIILEIKTDRDTSDTPDVDTIEEGNWESANALVDKLMGVGQK